MTYFDVFNGDADGVCALLQLRLSESREAELITGVKRDIQLLARLPVDRALKITALDISLDKNRAAVDSLLAAGSHIFYVDHHFPGEDLPAHPKFTSLINTEPTTCTSLLVDQYLQGRYRNWAIAAAFGDNLNEVALELGRTAGLQEQQITGLQELGVCINYNGYGATLDDLYFHPADLYRKLLDYRDPLDLIGSRSDAWEVLRSGYTEDMQRGLSADELYRSSSVLVISLPDAPWARRVSGVLGNEIANRNPQLACAILTENGSNDYLVSIRAPLLNRMGADEVARQFPSGGGRKAAAGINQLPSEKVGQFVAAMEKRWG